MLSLRSGGGLPIMLLTSTGASGLKALSFPQSQRTALSQEDMSLLHWMPQPPGEANLDPGLDLLPTDLAERLEVRTGGERAVLEVPLTSLVPVLPLQLQLR